ncbi:MAG: hypothetical protein ABW061_20110 [Polyangiaceae bacterium]
MSIFRQFAASSVAAAIALYGAHSQAHSTFPTLIQNELGMPCVPACTICHKDNLGGYGTITEPFGKSMQAAGLLFVEQTLSPALKKLETDGTDSDGDGIPDITELRVGQDPNGNLDLCSQAALAARYGCGAHIAPSPGRDSGAWLGALLTALVLGASLQRSARRERARKRTQKGNGHTR